jgi:polyvinyl alcohol dehydrogenase (cytochrome)
MRRFIIGCAAAAALAMISWGAHAFDNHVFDHEWDDADWPMYNHDVRGTRHNRAESVLNPHTVAGLHVKWTFPTQGIVNSTPAVAGDVVYAGDNSGAFYSLGRDGTLLWEQHVGAAITASALVMGDRVLFGDQAGFIHGLDRHSGAILWSVQPNPHPEAAIYGSPTPVGRRVAIGISSNEEAAAGNPGYPCCTFRGSVALLDPADGTVGWQHYFITEAQSKAGASGVGVWATPTYDRDSGLLYVTTGNNYTTPTTGNENAIVALDARSGDVVWVNQRTPDDSWNFRYPISPGHIDADFGDSAQIYWAAGRKVVGAGQKTGFYFVLDAATGKLINQLQVEPDGPLGGLFADTAVAGDVVYANGTNWPNADSGGPPIAGDLIAIAGDGSRELWRSTAPASPDLSGVAVAGGVVYFQSLFNGNLYALDQGSGKVLAQVAIGQAASGPSVSRGQIYVGTGNFLNAPGPASILALGL